MTDRVVCGIEETKGWYVDHESLMHYVLQRVYYTDIATIFS